MKIFNTLKPVIYVVLCIGLILGIVAICGGFKSDKEFDRIRLSYDVGGLTDTGKYTETKLSIYTYEPFECEKKTIRLAPTFDSSITYEIHFYNEDGATVGTYTAGTETQTIDAPKGATHARIELTPIWDEDVKDSKKELGLLDTYKYAKQLIVEISVDDIRYDTAAEKA